MKWSWLNMCSESKDVEHTILPLYIFIDEKYLLHFYSIYLLKTSTVRSQQVYNAKYCAHTVNEKKNITKPCTWNKIEEKNYVYEIACFPLTHTQYLFVFFPLGVSLFLFIGILSLLSISSQMFGLTIEFRWSLMCTFQSIAFF